MAACLTLAYYASANEIVVQGTTNTDIRQAIGTLNTQGSGTLYFPAGEYTISDLNSIAASNVWLRGDGPATIIKITASGSTARFKTNSSTKLYGFKVSDMRFIIDSSLGNGVRCLEPEDSDNVIIEDCDFEYAGTADATYAIVTPDSAPISIQRCRFIGLQVQVTGGPGLNISNNYFEDTRRHGIRINTLASDPLSGITIHGNIFNGIAGTGQAVFIGNATVGGSTQVLSDIQITENQIIGESAGAATSIRINGSATNENILIKNNIVANEEDTAGNNTSNGIIFETTSTASSNRVLLSGNVVENHYGAGISIKGAADSLIITENHVDSTVGLEMIADGDINAIINNNYFTDNTTGIDLVSQGGDLITQIRSNRFLIPDVASSHGLQVEYSNGGTITTDAFQNTFSYGSNVTAAIKHVDYDSNVTSRYYDNYFYGDFSKKQDPVAGGVNIVWRNIQQ